MRREAYEMKANEEVEAFLREMSYGTLAMQGDEWPYAVPINYVYHRGHLYVHGSKIGRKMEELQRNDKVCFSVAKEYAIIPSYFSDPKFACPATAYFKSVLIRGRAAVVEDLYEKADVLEALMQKLQPEGGYDPITPEDEAYLPRIRGVAIVRITVEHLTAKFAFGQHLSEERRERVQSGLMERGRPADRETAELMERYRPPKSGEPH